LSFPVSNWTAALVKNFKFGGELVVGQRWRDEILLKHCPPPPAVRGGARGANVVRLKIHRAHGPAYADLEMHLSRRLRRLCKLNDGRGTSAACSVVGRAKILRRKIRANSYTVCPDRH